MHFGRLSVAATRYNHLFNLEKIKCILGNDAPVTLLVLLHRLIEEQRQPGCVVY